MQEYTIFDWSNRSIRSRRFTACPPEDIMKTVAMIRLDKVGRTFWKEVPNSIPEGATVSARVGVRQIPVHFAVDHVHVALHEDVRVLCFVGNDPLTNQFLKSEVFEGESGWYDLEKTNGSEAEAVHDARYAYLPLFEKRKAAA